jgi:hypothetical protein
LSLELLVIVSLIVLIIRFREASSISTATSVSSVVVATAVASAITTSVLLLKLANLVLVEGRVVAAISHLGSSELGEVLLLQLAGVSHWQASVLAHHELRRVHATTHRYLLLVTVVLLLLVLYKGY